MNWDDLKVFLAVARRKKLATAATEVNLDVTTISRRIKRLETSLGQTLFERLRSGHVLTTHGEELFVKAEQIEDNIFEISSSKSLGKNAPSGTLRVSVAEGFGAEILSPLLGKFKSQFPDIEIDLVSGSGFLSLSKREADVAIGLTRPKSKHIVSELLYTYRLHLYAHESYLQSHPEIRTIRDLKKHTLIDYVDDLIYSDQLRYFEKNLPNLRPEIRSTSILAQKKLVEYGAGLAILPDFLVNEELIEVLPKKIRLERNFWFLSHQTVAPLAKVRAFKTFTVNHLRAASQ